MLERAVLLAEGDVIEVAHLPFAAAAVPSAAALNAAGPVATTPAAPVPPAPAEVAAPVAPPIEPAPSALGTPLAEELAALEQRRILDALEQCGGNQSRAAELLGMPRRTLIKRLQQYGVPRPRKK